MTHATPLLSIDQVAAFVELARAGSLRAAAETLHLTEQGVRNRLISLEGRLGVSLYHKQRGPRRRSPLTRAGERILSQATDLLERARQFGQLFSQATRPAEVHVAATQYLTLYVLIDAVRAFHRAFPSIRIRLSTRTERDIEDALVRDPNLAFGVAAPYESGADLDYQHLFSLDWGLITPPRHSLLRKRGLSLTDLADVPLMVFERGSTGRQHVLDAFHGAGLSPRIDMEATTTGIMVKMVEAGLGLAIVPLMPNGAVTRGLQVSARSLAGQIRPIHSGILCRRGEAPDTAAKAFIQFLRPDKNNRPEKRPK